MKHSILFLIIEQTERYPFNSMLETFLTHKVKKNCFQRYQVRDDFHGMLVWQVLASPRPSKTKKKDYFFELGRSHH